MINYIDYYFEASKKTLKEKKPVSIVKPTNTTLPLELKSEWENHWNEIKNIFLGLTGGGVWKEVEEDFREIAEYIDGKNTIQSNKWGPASQNTLRPWREFFDLLFFKMHKNKTIETINGIRPGEKWKTPNLDILKKEIVQYIIIKAFSFNNKGNLQYNKNIKNVLEKLIDLNKISEANFTEFKDRFEEQNNINVNEFPNLIVFLSHPYRAKYYDSQISKFMTGKPGKVKGQTLAEYTGYFNPSNNVTDTSIEDNPQIDISNSSINNTDSKYLKKSKKLLKTFIKNVYHTTDEDIKEIIEIQAGLGNFLPPLTTITDNSSHEKLARNILYQLSFFKKDLDLTEILEDFLFFYNKNVSNKISLDSNKLTPQAQKELKDLKNELADAIKKLKEAEETIEIIKGNALTKKISLNEKYKLSNAQTNARNLKKQISTIKDQLEAYQWSDDSIQNYMNNIKQSLPAIRKSLFDIVQGSSSERKDKKIERGEIDATKKYLEELAQALKNLKKEVKEKFLEIWKTYGDFLLGGDSNTQFKDQWGAIEDEFTAYLNQKLETKLNSLNLPKGRVRDELLAKTKASAEATIDEIRKSSLISFNNYKQELKDIKKTYEKLSKQQRGFIRNVIRDTDGKFFKKVIEQLWKNRKDVQKRNIDDIINNGLEKDSSPEEIKAEIGAEIKKETETLNKEIKKAENSRTIVDWLSVPEVIKFIKTNFTDPEDKTLYGWISTVKNDSHLYSLKDVYRELHLVKKDSERAEIANLMIGGESTNPLIKSVLKRHILQ